MNYRKSQNLHTLNHYQSIRKGSSIEKRYNFYNILDKNDKSYYIHPYIECNEKFIKKIKFFIENPNVPGIGFYILEFFEGSGIPKKYKNENKTYSEDFLVLSKYHRFNIKCGFIPSHNYDDFIGEEISEVVSSTSDFSPLYNSYFDMSNRCIDPHRLLLIMFPENEQIINMQSTKLFINGLIGGKYGLNYNRKKTIYSEGIDKYYGNPFYKNQIGQNPTFIYPYSDDLLETPKFSYRNMSLFDKSGSRIQLYGLYPIYNNNFGKTNTYIPGYNESCILNDSYGEDTNMEIDKFYFIPLVNFSNNIMHDTNILEENLYDEQNNLIGYKLETQLYDFKEFTIQNLEIIGGTI